MNTAPSIELSRMTIAEKRGDNGPVARVAGILIASVIGLTLWIGIFLALIAIF